MLTKDQIEMLRSGNVRDLVKDKAIADLIAHIDELEVKLANSENARREAQLDLQLAREARNRAGVEIRREMQQKLMAERHAYLMERAKNERLERMIAQCGVKEDAA